VVLFFAKSLNYFGLTNLSESNFTLVGMAGLIAGVLHAP
jgi:CIC family chloride channel protein